MKRFLDLKRLPVLVAGMGVLGWALRSALYAFCVDNRGLLPRSHPVEQALWLVTALTVALIAAAVRKSSGDNRYEENFGASLAAAVGHILLAAGVVLTVLGNPPVMAGRLGQIWKLLGIVSGPMLLYAGFSRVVGKKPFFLSYVVVCLFLALHLVSHYRLWCSDPQLQDYVFTFVASLGMMVFAYYQAEACVTGVNRRNLLFAGLLTAFLCLVSVSGTQYLYLYLGGAAWAFTGLCSRENTTPPEKKAGGDDASC